MITIYCGIYFQAGKGDDILKNSIVKWAIFCAILFPSLGFLIYFIEKLRLELLRWLATVSKFFFKIASFGRVDIHDFLEREDEDSD